MGKPLLILVMGSLLLSLGCATGTDGDGGYPRLSLGWAYEIAEGVREAEFPDGELVGFNGVRLDEDGFIIEQAPLHNVGDPSWTFYFQDNDYSTGHRVIVYADGSVESEDTDYYDLITIPSYYDAAEWVHIADDLVFDYEEHDWDLTFRDLRVFYGMDGFECNTAWIAYFYEEELTADICHLYAAEVTLNADTNEILDWHIY